MTKHLFASGMASVMLAILPATGESATYLHSANMTVGLGPSMSPEPFANRTAAASLASIIDLESADASEFHTQSTHVWVSGGSLELVFDFEMEYDLTHFHFWNYHSEGYDVDDVLLTFFDGNGTTVGQLNVQPALGNGTGSDATPIFAEHFGLDFPSRARYVNALLTGTNGQVDFNNMGFTGDVSPIPLPATAWLLLSGAALLGWRGSRASRALSSRADPSSS